MFKPNDPNLTRQTGSAIALDGVPERIELIPTGRFRTADARGEFTLADAKGVIERSMAMAKGGVLLIDFGHGVQGQAEKRSDAAGWISALDIEGNRIMASVEWTPAGQAAIRDKSYRFISPVFFNRPDREVVLVTGAGLVNDPALPILRQLASKENDHMDLSKIAKALGLPEDADEAAIIAAAEKANAPTQQLASVLKAAGVEELTADAAKQICARLTTKADDPDPKTYVTKVAFDEVSQQLASLQKQVGDDAVEKVVSDAKSAGKVTPALEPWARQLASKDMDGFKAFLKSAPVLVSPGREHLTPAETGKDGLTEAERQMCASTGIDPAKFAEQKQKDAE